MVNLVPQSQFNDARDAARTMYLVIRSILQPGDSLSAPGRCSMPQSVPHQEVPGDLPEYSPDDNHRDQETQE
jgi:hypothetical protein